MADKSETNAGLVILSVLLPIIGYILYFAKKENEPGPATNYMWSAVAGSIVGLIMAFS